MKKIIKCIMLVMSTILLSILLSACGSGGGGSSGGGSSDEGGSSNPSTTGLVIGKVRDSSTSQFITGAIVSIGSISDTTDIVGDFWLSSVPEGNQSVNATATGYAPYSSSINVVAGQTNSHSIYLTQVPSSVTLYSTADAYVSDGSPSQNYGSSGGLYTGTVYGYNYRMFVKFDVSGIATNAQITKATLYLKTGANSVPCDRTTSANVTVSEVLNTSWTEGGLTYFNMPSTFKWIYSKTVTNFNDCISHDQSFNVTTAVNDWVSGTNPNYGLSIKSSNINDYYGNGQDYCTIYSKEVSQGAGPQLYIEYN